MTYAAWRYSQPMQNVPAPSSTGSVASSSGPVPASPPPSTGPSVADASFAGLLATLAASRTPDSSWNDDELAEDVATISYEQALRQQSRPSPTRSSLKSKNDAPCVSDPKADSAGTPKPLRTSSITIRLSETECAQLRRRAAEAELTVSAYLRSCTLEVESLRAQVKQTLAELRNSAANPIHRETKPESEGRISSLFAALRRRFRFIGRRKAMPLALNAANPFAPVR